MPYHKFSDHVLAWAAHMIESGRIHLLSLTLQAQAFYSN